MVYCLSVKKTKLKTGRINVSLDLNDALFPKYPIKNFGYSKGWFHRCMFSTVLAHLL